MPNFDNYHRNRVMRVTYKTSILYYTVIDLILLGAHDGGTCGPSCRGVVWRVSESDAVIQVEVNPPDAHAPSISDPYPS